MGELEERAKDFATEQHARVKQVRKYTGEPYITHPAAVAEIVRSVPHTEEMLAAAWLHDVVEDTRPIPHNGQMIESRAAGIYLLDQLFGRKVAELVGWLTDVSAPHDGNRQTRKQIDLEHTANAPADAQTVKLADLIDNGRNITARDPGFAKVYLAEKRRLLLVITKGNQTLWRLANEIVNTNGTAFTSLAPTLTSKTAWHVTQIAAAGPKSELQRLFDILDKNPPRWADLGEELEAVEDANGVVWILVKKTQQPVMLMARDVWDSFQGGR